MGRHTPDFSMNLFVDAVFGIISGAASSVGLGGGAVLIMYLTTIAGVEQMKAQGINLIFFIPAAFVTAIIYSARKLTKWKIIIKTAFAGIVGSFLTFLVLKHINTLFLSKVFGIFLLVMGVFFMFKRYDK
jgi:uncharacterized membrane protein YfcA